MVTGASLYKQRLFSGCDRLDILERSLLSLSKEYLWQLEAWSAFANHYHIIARGNDDAKNLGLFLNHLHGETARKLNAFDQATGREVWYNFWDSKLTYQKSYLARLTCTRML
jgi:putative transposase